MSKIIAVINVMVANESKITKAEPVHSQNNEVAFVYDNKYLWSIRRDKGDYHMWYYPGGPKNLDSVVHNTGDWEFVDRVYYGPDTFAAREALASVSELHKIVSEKMYGMDQVFEDILKSDESLV